MLLRQLTRLLDLHDSLLRQFRIYKDFFFQPIVGFFSLCRIHPLALSLLGLALGLMSLRALFASYGSFVALMGASVLLDGLDGALARHIQYREPLGEYVDYFVDSVLMVSMYIALVCWLEVYPMLSGLGFVLLAWILGWQYYGACKVNTCRITLFLPAMVGFPLLGLYLVPHYTKKLMRDYLSVYKRRASESSTLLNGRLAQSLVRTISARPGPIDS